jgi:hypothetical protein
VKGIRHFSIQIILFVAVCAAWLSCAKKSPEGVLTKQEMVQIMEKLYIAEEKINHLALSRDSARKVFLALKAEVFESAATKDTVFKTSFDYYMERPKEMELIYTALVDSLQLREQRVPFHTDHQ